ncbi:MAG: YgaP family membrane protein [Candidatus Geothermincolia bacterium]
MAKKEKKEKQSWKFFWKNVGGLGRLNRLVAGIAMIYGATKIKDDTKKAAALAAFGTYLVVIGGLLGWCSLRATFKKPTKRAYRRHYPEG